MLEGEILEGQIIFAYIYRLQTDMMGGGSTKPVTPDKISEYVQAVIV